MYLKEIYIDNFKTLRKVRIHFDNQLNVFTGTNNAGKTTVLEAIALWSECFRNLVVKAKKADPNNGIRQGDYRIGTKNGNYIDHRSISSVRTSKYEDIFYEMNTKNKIVIIVKVVDADFELSIPIKINSANGGNYLIALENHDRFDFATFNLKLNLPTPFISIYASPVAALVTDEIYVTPPQINQQILSRKSFLVLRNRIAKIKSSLSYQSFENDVSYVLFSGLQPVKFDIIGDINKDVKVNVNVFFGSRSSAKDISLLGSGTLQVIELMLAIYEERSDLNLIMLDEPDSHIHRDIQKRLIEVLTRNSLRAQVFLTTHNESLIRATNPKNIFHINNSGDGVSEILFKPISYGDVETLKVGIQPSGKSKVIRALGNTDSLDVLDCIEARKVIFVEGEDDALFLRSIYEKVRNQSLDGCVFWSLNGLDTFIDSISNYRNFFGIISTGHDIWRKSIAVIDADYMTDSQRVYLSNQLASTLNLRTFIWNEYTIESSLLTETAAFSELLFRVLVSNSIETTREIVYQIVRIVLNDYCNQLIHDLNENPATMLKIQGQMTNRNKSWSDKVRINKVFNTSETSNLIDFQTYARPLLQNGNCYHMAGKDDLSKICTNVFNYFSFIPTYSPLSLFQYIIQHYDNSIEIRSWNRLVDFIDQV